MKKAKHSSNSCLSSSTPHSAQTKHCTITVAVFEQTRICESTDLRFKKGIVVGAGGRSMHNELLPHTGFSHADVGQVLILQLNRSLQTDPELKPKHLSLFSLVAQDFMSMGYTY